MINAFSTLIAYWAMFVMACIGVALAVARASVGDWPGAGFMLGLALVFRGLATEVRELAGIGLRFDEPPTKIDIQGPPQDQEG